MPGPRRWLEIDDRVDRIGWLAGPASRDGKAMNFYQVGDLDLNLTAATVLVGGAMAADVAELGSRTVSIEQILRTVE
jgi:hypothetical protein